MASTKLVAFAVLVAVAKVGSLRGTTPGYTRQANEAFYRTSPVHDASSQSQSSTPALPVSSKDAAGEVEVRQSTEKAEKESEGNSYYDSNPSYSYSYDIKNVDTGDMKTHSERLENGVVKGSYAVLGPDGIKRTVEYTADAVSGFNAVVNMEKSSVVLPKATTAPPNDARSTPGPQNPNPSIPTPTFSNTLATSGQVLHRVSPADYKASPLVYDPSPVAYRAQLRRVLYVPIAPTAPQTFRAHGPSRVLLRAP